MTTSVQTKLVHFLRALLLWPILWWGFSPALYCGDVQLAPPAPLALDLSRISPADIERTVLHLQQLVHEAESRADALAEHLEATHLAHAAAISEELILQHAIDATNARAEKAEAATTIERSRKWFWFRAWAGTVALVAAFFIARQYLPFLKAI